jgi:hypothetical protein
MARLVRYIGVIWAAQSVLFFLGFAMLPYFAPLFWPSFLPVALGYVCFAGLLIFNASAGAAVAVASERKAPTTTRWLMAAALCSIADLTTVEFGLVHGAKPHSWQAEVLAGFSVVLVWMCVCAGVLGTALVRTRRRTTSPS